MKMLEQRIIELMAANRDWFTAREVADALNEHPTATGPTLRAMTRRAPWLNRRERLTETETSRGKRVDIDWVYRYESWQETER